MSEWIDIKEREPGFADVNIKTTDGSIIKNALVQHDGDFYWRSPWGQEIFISEFSVTHYQYVELPEVEE